MLNLHSRHLWRAGLLAGLVGAASAVACGGSDESIGQLAPGSTGGFNFGGFPTSGTAGYNPSGGFVGSSGGFVGSSGGFVGSSGGFGGGGVTGTGGTTPDGGSPEGGTCNPPATLIDTSAFPACTGITGCTDGRCVPNGIIPKSANGLLATCDANNTCAPDIFVQYASQYTPPTCKSVSGFEGRCLSKCIPQVSQQASLLPKDICKDSELCAPCYDPRTGAATGACTQGCDTGPKNPPQTFAKCCSDNGSCVPKSIVPTADVAQLGADTCTGTDILCAPTKLTDTTYKPPKCVSLANLEGRCLPDCLPAIQAQKDRLPKATCDVGELCAPCYDPITGKDTGACTRAGDKPTDPPKTFPTCCGPLGHCVPSTILTTAQQSLLGKDTCTATGDLCAPDVFAGSGLKATTCRSLGSLDAEGRCIPSCLPSIQAQASRLDQSTCSAGYLCAPCFDPITGANTNACNQNGDAPAEQPKTFASCCSGNGKCVPTTLVPTSEQSQLGKDTCTGTGDLCAPTKLTDTTYKPPTCNSIGGFEGRCLADCVPAVASQAKNLPKDTCGTGELCAPCYDPFTGNSTGACGLNGDKPVDPPTTFDKCCNDLGHCVPKANLSTDQQTQLGVDTCGGTDLCAPDVFAAPGDKAQTCRAVFGTALDAEGRCVPDCVPMIQAQASRLSQGTCPANTLCAPCYDPITGANTNACNQNGDAPKEAEKTFTACCGNLGVCVPSSLVPANQTSQLGPDTCTGGTTASPILCAPKALTDPTVKPTACTAPGNMEARCLPACLPSIQKQASNLRQVTCPTGELCAPCYNPIDSTDTQACRINGDAPTQPAKPFSSNPCGNGRGWCVPTELVPSGLASAIPACTGMTGYLCAPIEKVKDINFKYPTCAPQIKIGPITLPQDPTQPAVCLPKYIIDYQAQTNTNAGLLQQTVDCQTGEICAPCKDPTTQATTHACD